MRKDNAGKSSGIWKNLCMCFWLSPILVKLSTIDIICLIIAVLIFNREKKEEIEEIQA